jgi:DNA-directed RNA polymerase specialized sigma24 family protein
METTLNNYTIDDFIKLEPVIFEYCINLTQKKRETFWYRDLADAKDLYQEVFLYVHDYYFNKPKELTYEARFIQMMKNCTYWAFHRRITKKGAKLYRNLNRIDDSPKDLFLFEQSNYEQSKSHFDFRKSLDYEYYTKSLKPVEIKAIELYLDGFPIKEIDVKCGKHRGFFEYTTRVKLLKVLKKDIVKPAKPLVPIKVVFKRNFELKEDDAEFLKTKLKNYDNIFNFKRANDKNIKMYSLYLQGVSITELSETFKMSKHQISVELFRIKQKIKKYE